MFSKLKAAWARMTGGLTAGEPHEPSTPAIEYQGYRIRPIPYRTEGQYQTAGIIEKDFSDGPKQHRFIRADTHQNTLLRCPARLLILALGQLGKIDEDKKSQAQNQALCFGRRTVLG
jgi:hypothetical protein